MRRRRRGHGPVFPGLSRNSHYCRPATRWRGRGVEPLHSGCGRRSRHCPSRRRFHCYATLGRVSRHAGDRRPVPARASGLCAPRYRQPRTAHGAGRFAGMDRPHRRQDDRRPLPVLVRGHGIRGNVVFRDRRVSAHSAHHRCQQAGTVQSAPSRHGLLVGLLRRDARRTCPACRADPARRWNYPASGPPPRHPRWMGSARQAGPTGCHRN